MRLMAHKYDDSTYLTSDVTLTVTLHNAQPQPHRASIDSRSDTGRVPSRQIGPMREIVRCELCVAYADRRAVCAARGASSPHC